MSPETLEALEGSIEKWRKIVKEGGTDAGVANCPLCQLFHSADCDGCPVMEKTGDWRCNGSPYDRWHYAEGEYGPADTPAKLAAAKAELKFLRGLLPKKARK